MQSTMAGRPPLSEPPPFGRQLALFRKKRGLSQAQFAKLVGKTPYVIDYYERRAKNPTMEFIVKAVEVLKISITDLIVPVKRRSRRK